MNDEILKLYENKFMFSQAMRLTKDKDQAYDLVQDTFIKIIDNLDKYEHRGTIHGYVTTVMKRIHLNNIRRDDIRGRALDTYSDKYYPHEVDDAINYVYCRQLIKKCRHKEILKYQALGYTTEDIAEITGINKNTVFSKSRYMRKEMSKHK